MSDPDLEEDEDIADEPEDGTLVKNEDAGEDAVDSEKEKIAISAEALEDAIEAPEVARKRTNRRQVASNAPGAVVSPDSASFAAAEVSSVEGGLASGPQLAQTTLPPHKLEPSITAKYSEKRSKRRKSRALRKRRK
jgi:hypothetical protein